MSGNLPNKGRQSSLQVVNKTPYRKPKGVSHKYTFLKSDVSDPHDIERLYEEVTQQFPDLNIIVNNAGEMRLLDVQEASKDLENITREIDINLTGTIRMVHQFLPHLIKKTHGGNCKCFLCYCFYAVLYRSGL